MRHRLERAADAQYSVRSDWSQFNAFGRFLSLIAKMITLASGSILLIYGKTDYATFFFFIAFTDRIYGPILEIFNVVQNTAKTTSYYHKTKELFRLENERDDGQKILMEVSEDIVFRGVSFRYPSSERDILTDIDITLPKGKRIALVGHTGSGKSTITQLLMRFYEPTNGEISIGKTDIYEYQLESYRSRFAAVLQDTTLFNESLRHNLEYVRDGITLAEIKEACRQANVLEFIESLPEGWETVVGERGLKLSG